MTLGIGSKCEVCGRLKSRCITCGYVHCRCEAIYDELYFEEMEKLNDEQAPKIIFGVFLED